MKSEFGNRLFEENFEFEESGELQKVDATNQMSEVFPVELDKRGVIWAMGGNSEEAVADRKTGLQMVVDFDDVVATQDYVDWDKVALYRADPTAKGYDPTAYHFPGDPKMYLQDGHHRAVASKLGGNRGMVMTVIRQPVVKDPEPLHPVQQPRRPTGQFSNDPAHGFMSGNMKPGIPGVKASGGRVLEVKQ